MAITTLTPSRLSIARETQLIFASGVSITTVNPLHTLFSNATLGHNVSAMAKNVTITFPETPVELQSFMGNDSNNFQNQMFERKPTTRPMLTATLVVDEDESIETYFDKSATAVTGGYSRYQLGNDQGRVTDVLVTISGVSSGILNVALVASEMTKLGDVRISGPDSHWEQDVQVECLPKNFYWEFQD